uniref:FAD-dependent oxidoreductase n=1 Tax=Halobacteriovorax sp. TaxID=2020862 RepID=UPI003561BFD0
SKDRAQFLRRNKEIVDQKIFDFSFQGNLEDCFILDNESLMKNISNKISSLNITQHKDTIVDVSRDRVVTLMSGERVSGKKIISALGAYSNHFLNSMDHDHLNKSKVVPGDYLIFEGVDLESDSFVITMGHFNLVYRAYSKTILIGGTSLKDEWSAVDYVELRPLYDFFKKIIPSLPSFESGSIKTGLRYKGRRRRPFLGEISDSIYSFHGVYKNGFTFSFCMANQFVNKELNF